MSQSLRKNVEFGGEGMIILLAKAFINAPRSQIIFLGSNCHMTTSAVCIGVSPVESQAFTGEHVSHFDVTLLDVWSLCAECCDFSVAAARFCLQLMFGFRVP